MDAIVKELVAIGASVAANCQPCLKYHVTKAKEAGVDAVDIRQAIATGKMVSKGAGDNMDAYIADVIRGM
jgi:AhpD family alkylhydroperoxidase